MRRYVLAEQYRELSNDERAARGGSEPTDEAR